jgi:hypothetical protein
METCMHTRFYVAYFPINPYGHDLPKEAMDAARAALESRLGGAFQVLAAKAAFEEAGGLRAYWQGIYPPAITRWTIATHQAVEAAFQAAPPLQSSIEDIERLSVASIDVIALAHYAYTPGQWLDVFTAHFGMSDHCDSQDEAITAGRRWLDIAPGACPIAAADQEIRRRCGPVQHREPARNPSVVNATQAAHLTSFGNPGVQPCF